MKKNDVLKVNIEGYSSEGHGVAKPDGFVLFVPGALDGETVLVHVLKVNKHFGYAKIINILSPSPARVDPACAVCDRCGGCAMWHADYSEEKRFKKMKVTQNLRKAGIFDDVDDVVSADTVVGYRNKAQYPVREQNGKTLVGFYRNGSHAVIEGECKIQPRIFHDIAMEIKALMPVCGISAYNEQTGKGTLRHIYLRCNSDKSEIMLCLVVNGGIDKNSPIFEKLTAKFKEISTVCINYNSKNTNVILGERYEVVSGNGYITDTLCGRRFVISPQSFYQVNHDGCELLYSQAAEYVRGANRVLDLYCGIGTVGICTADSGARLTGVEIVPEAIENAKYNARLNGMDNTEFFAADAGAVKSVADGCFDAIIVDPPRKGCDGRTLDFIIEKAPERLVYISCDSATLARDLAILKEHFKIEKITPVDMFPRTHHIETVVLLSRENSKIHAFFANARLLSDTMGIVPLMYGSLGLEYLTGEDLNSDDIDILIPKAFITDRWDEFKDILENYGYLLTDAHEHTFEKNGISYSYAEIEELEPFAGIPMSNIVTVDSDNVRFKLLSLQQYLQVYRASAKDGYRVNIRNKKDTEKIAFIEKQLQKG